MYKKILMLLASFSFLFAAAMPVMAQEDTSVDDVETEDIVDEDQVEDVERIPGFLDNLFFNISERVDLFFTFDQKDKAEKELSYANRRAAQANYIIENSDDANAIARAESYLERASELQARVEEKLSRFVNEIDEETENLKDDFVHSVNQHRRVANAIANGENIPEEVKERLKLIKERQEERLSNFVENASDPEEAVQRIERALERNDDEGKVFKGASDIEFLERLQEKLPENAQEALEEVKTRRQERFSEFSRNENFERRIEIREEVRERVEDGEIEREERIEIRERVRDRNSDDDDEDEDDSDDEDNSGSGSDDDDEDEDDSDDEDNSGSGSNDDDEDEDDSDDESDNTDQN